jgi:RNA polymerase sigma-70 factor (ECF subfamily)
MNDSDPIYRALQGDEQAWTEIIAAHQEAVFRLAYLMVRDTAEADDIAQETFIRAYHARSRFDATRPLRPWLLSITVNLVRNQRRAWGRYLHAIRRWWQQDPPSESHESPETLTHLQGEASALGQAIQHLTHTDREVIALRFFLELSEQECADVLGIARGTVKSRQHRALERLRQVVAEKFPTLQEGRTHERTA